MERVIGHAPSPDGSEMLPILGEGDGPLPDVKGLVTPPAQLLNDAAHKMQRDGKAIASVVALRRAVALCPDSSSLWASLGAVLYDNLEYVEAEIALKRAIRLDRRNSRALANMGMLQCAMGRGGRGLRFHERAVRADPNNLASQWNQAISLLDCGQWKAGFARYDVRLPFRGPGLYPPMPYPRWNGEDLNRKTLFVRAEQGIGDRILFSRYLYWIKQRWPRVNILHAADAADLPTMVNLLWGYAGIVQFIPVGVPWPKAHFGVDMMSLPRLHGTRPDRVPRDPGFIRERAKFEAKGVNLPQPHVRSLKVGVVWTGNTNMVRNLDRSVPFEQMLRLEQIPEVQLYSLQFAPGSADMERLGAHELVYDLPKEIGGRGLVGTAACMLHLDLIITTCTSTAHLAGVLGVRCWTLLCANPYWVWGRKGERTPWYPKMKLYRQRHMGNWDDVIDRVRRDITRLAKAHLAKLS